MLTAPLTETIDHAGYFVQMALASLPKRLERIIDSRYPKWRDVERNEDGSARTMPAGIRSLEVSLLREYAPDDIAACYPDDLERFIGPRTRLVAVSTHNPLGVTFAAGVYASVFGSSREPINSYYARQLFARINANPHRSGFEVIAMRWPRSISFTNWKGAASLRFLCPRSLRHFTTHAWRRKRESPKRASLLPCSGN